LDEFPVFQKGLYDTKKTIYKYSLPQYALGNHLLNKSDQEQLSETLSILSRYRNREEFNWLDELFPRIESAFDLVHEDFSGLISYQSNRDYTGQPLVGKLYNQLVRKKVLEVEYQSFKESKSTKRVIHPYHLKQYNNRWFLFGYQEGAKYTGLTTLALDRILDFSELNLDIKPNDIVWGDYFDEIIGVSRDGNTEAVEIKLRFSKERIGYVLTKPIHGATQKMDKSDPENRTITILAIPNKELYQNLLSFGSDLEVITPDFVKSEIGEHVIKMSKYYNV
jgi:predicted DNA-binding transcriptional regulator YafY